MKTSLLILVVVSYAFIACHSRPNPPADVVQRFKRERGFETMKEITAYFWNGMPRSMIDNILGEPSYSPTPGEYYYYSRDLDKERGWNLGLSVVYSGNGENPDGQKLKSFYLGPIGE